MVVSIFNCLINLFSDIFEKFLCFSDDDFKLTVGLTKTELLKMCEFFSSNQPKTKKSRNIQAREEVLLFFIWLKCGLNDILLGFLFEIKRTTCFRIRESLLAFFSDYFSKHVEFRTFDERSQEKITFLGQMITVIIDGSEQPCRRSIYPKYEAQSFSKKKKQNSITTLVGVSPKGRILFITNSFFGSLNDDQMAKVTKSNWYDKLNEQEWILGDGGFRACSAEGWRVMTPKGSSNLCRLHSHFRIIVENCFAKFKKWAMCREKLGCKTNGSLILDFHHQIWICVGGILNMRYKQREVKE